MACSGITSRQIRKIHVLKSLLDIDDGDYRAMLSDFPGPEGKPASSSRDLTYVHAHLLIKRLSEIQKGMRAKQAGEEYANPAKMKRIVWLWGQVSRARDSDGRDKTLHAFVKNRFRSGYIDKIPSGLAEKVEKVLWAMRRRKQEREGKASTSEREIQTK